VYLKRLNIPVAPFSFPNKSEIYDMNVRGSQIKTYKVVVDIVEYLCMILFIVKVYNIRTLRLVSNDTIGPTVRSHEVGTLKVLHIPKRLLRSSNRQSDNSYSE
jgi:hypothetical protein